MTMTIQTTIPMNRISFFATSSGFACHANVPLSVLSVVSDAFAFHAGAAARASEPKGSASRGREAISAGIMIRGLRIKAVFSNVSVAGPVGVTPHTLVL